MKAVRISKTQRKTVAMLDALRRERVAAGTCRHCGGPVPCWSPFGDKAVGKAWPKLKVLK